MTLARLRYLLIAVACAGLACSSGSSSSSSASASSAPAAPDPVRPLTQAEQPTTDGGLAAGNLDGHIQGLEKRVKDRGGDPDDLTSLYEVVSEHQRFSSSVADLTRMLDLAERVVAAAPKVATSYITRASARAAVHRFAAAKEDMDAAVKLGATDDQLDSLRASIAQAEGDLDRALELRHKMSELRPSITNLGTEAVVLAELGRLDDAAALFRRAALEYGNVSAFAIAWLYFQEGAVWERARNLPRARAFYLAAHERLPMFAHAGSHYALLEKSDVSLAILTVVAATSDDPEFEWALAQVLRRNHKDADAHLATARTRYDALTAQLPEAYAEHAANFWLADGGDPQKALLWAKKNLEVRRSAAAYETALLAAIAAKSSADACTFRKGVEQLAHPPEMLTSIAKDACPKP